MSLYKKQSLLITTLSLLFFVVPAVAFAENGTNLMTEVLWWIVSAVFGNMAAIGGLLLNAGVNEFVIGFGQKFTTNGVGVAVDSLWIGVRDLFNITFIFGLVYIGLKMILNSGDASTKRWLASLIMAALLVNFSLFVTKFIVDTSNILASEIAIEGFQVTNKNEVAVSDKFLQHMGVQTMFTNTVDSKSGIKEDLPQGTTSSQLAYVFGAMIIFIVCAFVFAAGGFMLIIRFVTLSIFMILSPLMFIGSVFPSLKGVTSEYWKRFLGTAFFAPVYLLLLYFAAYIMRAFYTTIGDDPQFQNIFGGDGNVVTASIVTTLAPFILSCVFLIAAIKVASKMSAEGSSMVMKAGSAYRKKAQRALSWAPRKGGGLIARGGANWAGDKIRLGLDKAHKSEGIVGRIARNKFVGSTIDDAVSGTATRLKNAKFGLANTVDEAAAKHAIIMNRYNSDQTVKRGLAAQEELDGTATGPTPSEIWDANANNGEGAMVKRAGKTPDEIKRLLENNAAKGRQTINSMSQKELELMYKNDKTTFDKVINNVNASTFDKMMENDAISPQDKHAMSEARKKAVRETLGKNGDIITENLQRLSIQQIETLGDEFIRENAHLFSQSQMDNINKSKKFTDSQKSNYVVTRKNLLTDPARQQEALYNGTVKIDSSGNRTFTKAAAGKENRKPADIANLPFEMFISKDSSGNEKINYDAVTLIDSAVLEAIFDKKTMNVAQRSKLRKAIKNASSHVASTAANLDAIQYLRSPAGVKNWA